MSDVRTVVIAADATQLTLGPELDMAIELVSRYTSGPHDLLAVAEALRVLGQEEANTGDQTKGHHILAASVATAGFASLMISLANAIMKKNDVKKDDKPIN
jgi:hypothetical protein